MISLDFEWQTNEFMLYDFLNLFRVGFVCFFQQIIQKIEQLQPLVLRPTLSLFAVCHCGSPLVWDFSLLYHITQKEKRADFSAL